MRFVARPMSSARYAVLNSLNHVLAEAQRPRAEAQSLGEAIASRVQTPQGGAGGPPTKLSSLPEAVAEHYRQLSYLPRDGGGTRLADCSVHKAVAERDRWLAGVQTNQANTQRRLQSVRSSISWKITSTLPKTRRTALRIISLFRCLGPLSIATTVLPNCGLTVSDEIAARLIEPVRLVYCRLRAAAVLQRLAVEKQMSGVKPK